MADAKLPAQLMRDEVRKLLYSISRLYKPDDVIVASWSDVMQEIKIRAKEKGFT